MDELSLSWYVEPRGTVLRRFCGGGHIKASWKRARCTFICSIASDANFNSLLPAILIGNNHQFDHQFMRQAAATHGGKVCVWKHSTAWNTQELMKRYIFEITSLPCDRPLVLLCDMAPCHLGVETFQYAKHRNLRIVLIPSHLTPILQPLDVAVFRSFRCEFERQWNSARSAAPQGELSKIAWLGAVVRSVENVVRSRDWRHAFLKCGVLEKQAHVSQRLLKSLAWQTLPPIGHGMPGLGQMWQMFPKKRKRLNVPAIVQWSPDMHGCPAKPVETWD